jgi:GTPase-activating protein
LVVRKAAEDYAPLEEGREAHWEVVERLLFLYAKMNPGQGYVQGMNEIIGPIYYTFATDPVLDNRGKFLC